jgi:hypothetical protein
LRVPAQRLDLLEPEDEGDLRTEQNDARPEHRSRGDDLGGAYPSGAYREAVALRLATGVFRKQVHALEGVEERGERHAAEEGEPPPGRSGQRRAWIGRARRRLPDD